MKTSSIRDLIQPCHKRGYSLLFLLMMSWAANATIWYVKPGGTGTGSGSWANAAASANLVTIISGAASGDELWVVGSTGGTTYYPSTTSRSVPFTLKSGVSVFGGFAGTETALGQQNPAKYITILSGAGVTGNSYNVVVSTGNTATTLLEGFTIEDGDANSTGQYSTGGGIYISGSSVTFSQCIITGNTAIGNGGGVYVTGSGTVNFDTCTFSSNSTTVTFAQTNGGGGVYCGGETTNFIGCTFSANTSTSEGGGILTNGTVGTFTNCRFTHNSSSNDGGGFYLYQNGTYSFTQCAFDTCTATGSGGGIALASISNVPFHNCSFIGNMSDATGADYGGGGFYAVSGSNDTIANCAFSGNTASSYGGGFESNGHSSFVMRYTTFSNNNANVYGGGLSVASGNTFLVANSHFSNNAAPAGGGLYVYGGQPTLSYDTISNNTATATSGVGGGGICEDPSGANPTVSHCWLQANVTNGSNGGAIYDNSSQTDSNTVFQANIVKGTGGSGGAIYHNSQTGNIINCVFVDNSSTGYGGGYYDNATNETVENCTFYNNSATTAGAGMYDVGGGNPKYYGVITWGNTPDGFAVGAGSTSGFKVRYCDFQATLTFAGGSIANNQAVNPNFSNSANYVGADGKWATGDDGLHLAYSPTISPVADYQQSNYPADDIAEVGRPYVGNTNANEGAYEGPDPVLAIFLQDFTATAAGSHTADLNWEVNASSQIAAFQVQRSADGVNFSTLGTVNAVAGQTSYSYADEDADAAVLFYRLQIIDQGGDPEYSPVVVVYHKPSTPSVQLSVWPSTGAQVTRTLYIFSPGPATTGVVLSDVSGHLLWRMNTVLNRGDNYLSLDLGGFPAGAYYLVIVGPNGSRTSLMLEKL